MRTTDRARRVRALAWLLGGLVWWATAALAQTEADLEAASEPDAVPELQWTDTERADFAATEQHAAEQKAALVDYVECVQRTVGTDRVAVSEAASGPCGAARARYAATLPEGFEATVLKGVDYHLTRDSD
ncbi:MAG: hypothetical protein KF911_08730 [Pseudomonadales bacterium]|nr:hypothetical protein [Pseudomonadales bacterium]